MLGSTRAACQNVARRFVLAGHAPAIGRNGDRLNNRHHDKTSPPAARDWRRIHHSPLFWVGLAMCLAAIVFYVASEDLSWRPSGR